MEGLLSQTVRATCVFINFDCHFVCYHLLNTLRTGLATQPTVRHFCNSVSSQITITIFTELSMYQNHSIPKLLLYHHHSIQIGGRPSIPRIRSGVKGGRVRVTTNTRIHVHTYTHAHTHTTTSSATDVRTTLFYSRFVILD
jgi:hypothetical protein